MFNVSKKSAYIVHGKRPFKFKPAVNRQPMFPQEMTHRADPPARRRMRTTIFSASYSVRALKISENLGFTIWGDKAKQSTKLVPQRRRSSAPSAFAREISEGGKRRCTVDTQQHPVYQPATRWNTTVCTSGTTCAGSGSK